MPEWFTTAAIARLDETGLLVWLGGLALLVGFRLMTGDIELDGLLRRHKQDDEPAPERVLLLAATLGFALYYFITGLSTPGEGPRLCLPDVPEGVLTALLGTHGIYLTRKISDRRK
jgi:hypothetical protein